MTRQTGTEGFALNQTMLRIRDPKRSLEFYQEVLGMTLLDKLDFAEMKFSLYFLAFLKEGEKIPQDPAERAQFIFARETTLELTHNWGTEDASDFSGYHNGNDDPQGFGHIGITVPDVNEACFRFEEYGVRFLKRPDEGRIKGIAFISDPDGYWIEILSPAGMSDIVASDA